VVLLNDSIYHVNLIANFHALWSINLLLHIIVISKFHCKKLKMAKMCLLTKNAQ